MSDPLVSLPQAGFLQTDRRDAWWLQPLIVLGGLGAFVVYVNLRVWMGTHYYFTGGGASYLSPFYSPVLWGDYHHAWFGGFPDWWPAFITPAMPILWAPAGFRMTCYYYRGAYYKAFWADPPSCAVGEPRKGYRGEQKFPLIIQNIHRYLLYFALAFLVILAYDAWLAMWFIDEMTGRASFGIRVGTIVLTLNFVFLACYTFGCHSLRHLIGGANNTMGDMQRSCYNCVSAFNRKHMNWAWISLVWVAFSDAYVYACSAGAITDYRIF
jgi:hypothetical protein